MDYLKDKNKNKHWLHPTMMAKAAFGFLIFSLVLLPSAVQAAHIYFSLVAEEIYKDDIFIVETRVSSPDRFINAAESTLLFDNDKLEVKELSIGGSLFSLWPGPPVFSNQKGKISFIGGTPDGFQDEDALILKIIFLAKNKGEAVLDFQDNTYLFLHDGKGTQFGPWLRPLSLNILERPAEIIPKDEWQILIEKDKTPPEPFEILLGQDSAIFDNQYFISFFTTDKESGIDYYEIQEGIEPYVIGDSPYLLKDQKLRSIIRVKAIDKAGNERISELMPPLPPMPFYKNILFWLGVFIIIVLIVLYVLWRYFKRKSKVQNENYR